MAIELQYTNPAGTLTVGATNLHGDLAAGQLVKTLRALEEGGVATGIVLPVEDASDEQGDADA